MRTFVVFVLLAILTSILPAQVPVKKNLMLLIDQVPPPPASVRDAYAKTTSSNSYGTVTSNADKVFELIDSEIKSVEPALKTHPPMKLRLPRECLRT